MGGETKKKATLVSFPRAPKTRKNAKYTINKYSMPLGTENKERGDLMAMMPSPPRLLPTQPARKSSTKTSPREIFRGILLA